jgi:hypothetical protein
VLSDDHLQALLSNYNFCFTANTLINTKPLVYVAILGHIRLEIMQKKRNEIAIGVAVAAPNIPSAVVGKTSSVMNK